MRRVEAGESFTVTRNGVPVADLTPHHASVVGRRRFVPVGEIAAGLSVLADWGVERFRVELGELDEAVDDRDRDRWGEAG